MIGFVGDVFWGGFFSGWKTIPKEFCIIHEMRVARRNIRIRCFVALQLCMPAAQFKVRDLVRPVTFHSCARRCYASSKQKVRAGNGKILALLVRRENLRSLISP